MWYYWTTRIVIIKPPGWWIADQIVRNLHSIIHRSIRRQFLPSILFNCFLRSTPSTDPNFSTWILCICRGKWQVLWSGNQLGMFSCDGCDFRFDQWHPFPIKRLFASNQTHWSTDLSAAYDVRQSYSGNSVTVNWQPPPSWGHGVRLALVAHVKGPVAVSGDYCHPSRKWKASITMQVAVELKQLYDW